MEIIHRKGPLLCKKIRQRGKKQNYREGKRMLSFLNGKIFERLNA